MRLFATWTERHNEDYKECKGITVSEDGEVLAAHLSSTIDFLKHDLGVTSNWKHDIYDKKYGSGKWSIEWVKELPPEVRNKMKKTTIEEGKA